MSEPVTADPFAASVAAPEPADPMLWFCWRLGLHGVEVAERSVAGIRAALIEHGACVICGRGPAGKPESYGARFERVFGEALSQPVSRGTRPRSTQLRRGALK